jgi:hypothetical protein
LKSTLWMTALPVRFFFDFIQAHHIFSGEFWSLFLQLIT